MNTIKLILLHSKEDAAEAKKEFGGDYNMYCGWLASFYAPKHKLVPVSIESWRNL